MEFRTNDLVVEFFYYKQTESSVISTLLKLLSSVVKLLGYLMNYKKINLVTFEVFKVILKNFYNSVFYDLHVYTTLVFRELLCA